jgi:TRAP transporter TAXI family solute receptor
MRRLTSALAALAAASCGGGFAGAQSLPPTITLGTSQTGTLQHGVATGLAKVASARIGSSTVVVQPFTGATTALPLIDNGELDFGLAPSVDMAMSYQGANNLKIGGLNPYPHAPRIRLVMSGSPLIASLIVRRDSPIKSARDLKGRRIAGEFRGSLGAYINTYVHLTSADLTWKDVTVVPFSGLNDSLDAMVQGRIDATVFGVGAARVREVDATTGVRFVSSDCSPEGTQRIRKAAPGYFTITLKSGEYPGVPEEICTTAYSLYLFAGEKTPDAAVTAVLKALWEDADKLPPLHPGLRQWKRETAVDKSPTGPFHPAAIAFYKTVNAWSAEAEAAHNRLLALHKR